MQDGAHPVLHLAGEGENDLGVAVDAGLCGAALLDGAGDGTHGGDALREFVMQFACDQATLRFQAFAQRVCKALVGAERGIVSAGVVELFGKVVVTA